MTWSRSALYSVWHWLLKSLSVGFGWPLAGFGAVLRLFSMHFLNSGASGTCVVPVWPACWAWEVAATFTQWSKVVRLIVSSPILTTALPGTPPPHAARVRGSTKKAPRSARYRRGDVMTGGKVAGPV